MTYNTSKGFTLIELVVVVVLLAILSAVALPKYMNFTEDARTALVQSTAGSFAAGLNLAHAKWEVNGNAEYVNLEGDGDIAIGFTDKGWPSKISRDGKSKLADIADSGVSGHDACSQIIQNVINTTGLTIIAANGNGECTSGDFCARADKNQECVYTYRATNEKIRYRANTGKVIFE